jgi:uncharacterized protein YecE (DUF72 family)
VTATRPSVTGLHVGASGFSYPTWRGGFYPPDARPEDFLRLYAKRLGSVELIATFYRLPSEGQLAKWAEQTPSEFRFAVKMTRSITHFGNVAQVGTFCERIRTLGDRLGVIRVQFPENRERDDGMIEFLLGSLDLDLRYAFEFRHESWAGVEERLEEAGIPLVNALESSAPFRYLRLREPPYDEAALETWAARLRPLLDAGIELFVYFRHEDEPTAPAYAQRLAELLSRP